MASVPLSSYEHDGKNYQLNDLHQSMEYRTDGKPALRVITTFDGNIVIEGSVTIPGTITVDSTPADPVHNHITEVGTSGILNVPYLPVGLSYTVLNPLPVAQVPTPLDALFSFNNFDTNVHRGWTMSDTAIPLLSIRMKSGVSGSMSILGYEIGNNNNASSTVGYAWWEDTTITGADVAWQSLNTLAEYRVYTDAYGSNTPNGFTGGKRRHSGIVIGKQSEENPSISSIIMQPDGRVLTLVVKRLDSGTKLDIWFSIDTGILEGTV